MLFLEIIGGFIAFVLLLLCVLRLSGKSHARFEGAAPELSEWMGQIRDEVPLRRVVIPGSHDAGTCGVPWAGETQALSIAEQLLCGSRYFDVRVHQKGEQFVIFHSLLDGTDFKPILEDIRDFLQAHPSETVLLDFQHFKGESQKGVASLLEEVLGGSGLLIRCPAEQSRLEYVRALSLGETRGRCLVFWGDRAYVKAHPETDFLFARNDNECTEEDMCLDSYYLAKCHRRGTKALLEQAHPVYLARARRLAEEERDGLFVLQCQLTDGLAVRGPWSRERRHDRPVSEYIRSLSDCPDLPLLNILMRDFIKQEKCADIIALNRAKGNMK